MPYDISPTAGAAQVTIENDDVTRLIVDITRSQVEGGDFEILGRSLTKPVDVDIFATIKTGGE